ncbi:ras-related protein rab-5c [Anaeramoeba flamelloides]|uniref:Ras-related protein rab-5c n=1 Tax=Anaeramoeba flamelloides TaxID=1746091 RepID=A0AAV7Z4J8_9EUKA|nr:ras-related protein rab-5c [Anaeramoeba flamelloides]KAJ6251868.1 ras-related protein rab-5c [Anaeramoeba flamelloides]
MNENLINHKIVFLGESAVGKSSLVIRFVQDKFSLSQEPTVGAAFLTKKLKVDDLNYKLQIWDTAGQERYHSLAPMYYRGAAAAFVVYDITSMDSFERAKKWIEELKKICGEEIKIALLANKMDLDENQRVSKDIALEFATEKNLQLFETSAKTGLNVRKVFEETIKILPKTNTNFRENYEDYSDSEEEINIRFDNDKKKRKQQNSNCC